MLQVASIYTQENGEHLNEENMLKISRMNCKTKKNFSSGKLSIKFIVSLLNSVIFSPQHIFRFQKF